MPDGGRGTEVAQSAPSHGGDGLKRGCKSVAGVALKENSDAEEDAAEEDAAAAHAIDNTALIVELLKQSRSTAEPHRRQTATRGVFASTDECSAVQ